MTAIPAARPQHRTEQSQNDRLLKTNIAALRDLTQVLTPLASVITGILSTTMGNQRQSSHSMLLPFFLNHMLTSHVMTAASKIGTDGAALMGEDSDTVERKAPPAKQQTILERLNEKEEATAQAKQEEASEIASVKEEMNAAAQKLGGKFEINSTDKAETSSETDKATAKLKRLEAIIVKEQINDLSDTDGVETIRESSKKQRDAQLETDVINSMKDRPDFSMKEASRVTGLLEKQFNKLDELQDKFAATDDKTEQKAIMANIEQVKGFSQKTLRQHGLEDLDSQDYSLREAKTEDESKPKFAWGKTSLIAARVGIMATAVANMLPDIL